MQVDHFSVPIPAGFSLAQAVCSYGFFTQAPNAWQWQVSMKLRLNDVRLSILRIKAGLMCLLQEANHTGTLASMQRRLLSSGDSVFGVVLQQASGVADGTPAVVVQLDTAAQQHELQQLRSQVACHTSSPSLSMAKSMSIHKPCQM